MNHMANVYKSPYLDRPVSSVTRQPSDRRPGGANASSSGSSAAAAAAAAATAGAIGGASGLSTTVTDNGNSSVHHHIHSQGSFSSPKNGSMGLPVTVTDAIASQCIDINASHKEGEKHLR